MAIFYQMALLYQCANASFKYLKNILGNEKVSKCQLILPSVFCF